MNMSGNTILITGGATGIGYALAKYFQKRGNMVIICGRRANRLVQAEKEIPGVHTFVCDVADPRERETLFRHIKEKFPAVNILINNAGIQRDIDLTKGTAELDKGESEIKINLEAPVELSALFTPFLAGKKNAAIVNISSGLAFMVEKAVRAPLYCATKAALHAFSIAQRIQLAPLGIKIIEIIPPMVESELNLESRIKRNVVKSPHMLTAENFVEKMMVKMEQGLEEIKMF